MSQWGQGQPGYQYPVQTGFPGSNPQFQQQNPQFQQQNPQFQQQNPQFQQQNPQFQQGGFGNAGLVPQQTGFPGQRMQGFQQPQQTGFQGPGMMQAQPTGFPAQGGNFQQQSRQAPPPPVPPLPTQFQQQNQASGFLGLPQQQQQQQPQVNRFLSASPGFSGPGLVPQATGFPGRSGPLAPQMTGFVDPRLQMMSSTFMPMNAGPSFGAPSAPQLAPPQFNLQQSFQQHNQAQRGTSTPQMSWALTKAEKKQYNDIFRSWDAQSTGFINGQTALDVFGASGLPKDDLARIWTLADIDDRGKLNIAEFHVAMGLIYRRLSGMPVPEHLPPELVPPSSRDLDNSVDMIKDLLKHESRARSPSSLDSPISRLKTRSFNSSSSTIDSARDATIYKHSDSEPPGGFYQSRSRHVNRDDVRSRNETDSPSAELSDMKRMLANTAQMLERNAESDASRTAEDEALDREMDDLKYRVKRVSEDLEYVSQGPKTAAKDKERRKLERELLSLMHERVPEVERKIKARDERKEREKRQWARDRDRTNERFGRYDSKDESPSGRYDDRDRDRPYSRGGYDRGRDRDDRDQDRGSYRDEGSRSRSRDYRRAPSPPPVRSAPPPPPPAPPSSIRDPPAAPSPRPTPSPGPLKNMTAEERQAYARAEAKRRIEARMAALGVTAPSSSPTIDTSVEDRLLEEKKEAEERAKIAEKQAEERERLRRERLEGEKAAKEGKTPSSPIPPAAAPPAPTPTTKALAPAPTPSSRPAPPPAPKRAPAPPPPRNAKPPAARPPVVVMPPAPPAVVAPPSEPEVDPEEERLRAREEAIRKQREARAEKLRQLEKEEEEAARQEEERYQARLQALKAKSTPSPSAPTPAFTPAPYKAPTPPPAVPPAPPTPVVTTPAVDTSKSTNPFSRLIKEGTGSSATSPAVTPATNGSTNPWAKPQTAPPTSAPNPPKSPTPASAKVSYNTAPSSAIDDDWEDIKENEDDDSSDDDELSGRAKRENIARQLFGGILPTSRPQSAAGVTTKPGSSPSSPAPSAPPPPPPPPPSAPPAINIQTEAPFAPPPPPPPAAAPVAPTAAAPAGDMSGLMRSIQGGLKLRPAKTVDKSAPPVSGRVLGDTAPPPHINSAPRPVTPPQTVTPPPVDDYLPIPAVMSHDDASSRSSNRQSVGWFADRAADAGVEVQRLPSTTEEEEDIYGEPESSMAPIPAIHINEPSSEDTASDIMSDIDKTIEHRARTLYHYEGEGPDDLSFGENLVITANPSKSGGDWWYGTLVDGGKSGVFPKTYVQVVEPVKAKAMYTYTCNNSDELPFTEGDELTIIDTSEDEWWKAERGGVVFIVPAAYLEIVEG